MSGAAPVPRATESSHAAQPRVDVLRALALGFGVALLLLALYAAWELAFGHLRARIERPIWSDWSDEMRGLRIALTLIALIGFLVGAQDYGRRALDRDGAARGPMLRGPGDERAALRAAARDRGPRRMEWFGALAAIPISLLVVSGNDPSVPFLLSGEPWSHDMVWALGCNALLFGIMGRIAVGNYRTTRLFSRLEERLAPVDLLRPQALAPFARRGLRTAFLWIGGSSIASIVFVNQDFSWMTGLVLVVTLGLGTLAFLQPMRGVHRRLRAAKESELDRVRSAIERARGALLDEGGSAEAGSRMPGLLAYEKRIAEASEWPISTPQVLRFGLMIAIGLGSWVGGAVIEHLMDPFW